VFARSQGNPFFVEELLAVVKAGYLELPLDCPVICGLIAFSY
jgi:hypothetical protein